MNDAMNNQQTTDPVASLLAGQVDLGLAALTVKGLGVDPHGPDEDGDLRLILRYAVTNTTAVDLEYLDIRTQLLTPAGLILEESQDTELVMAMIMATTAKRPRVKSLARPLASN